MRMTSPALNRTAHFMSSRTALDSPPAGDQPVLPRQTRFTGRQAQGRLTRRSPINADRAALQHLKFADDAIAARSEPRSPRIS